MIQWESYYLQCSLGYFHTRDRKMPSDRRGTDLVGVLRPLSTIRLSHTTRQDVTYDTLIHWFSPIATDRIRHSCTTESDSGLGPLKLLAEDRFDDSSWYFSQLDKDFVPCLCSIAWKPTTNETPTRQTRARRQDKEHVRAAIYQRIGSGENELEVR